MFSERYKLPIKVTKKFDNILVLDNGATLIIVFLTRYSVFLDIMQSD